MNRKKFCVVRRFTFVMVLLVCTLGFIMPAAAASNRVNCTLTEAEKNYVQDTDFVTVAVSPDNFPYSYIESGKAYGIFPELLKLVSYETGLKFSIYPCSTYAEYSDLKKNGTADIIIATHVSSDVAESLGYHLTSPYFQISYSKIELKENGKVDSKAAALEEPSAEATIAARYYYSDQILYCKSMEECTTALQNGKCEALIVNSYNAQYMQYSDVKNQYIVKELYDNKVDVCAGVNSDCPQELYNIMEKALASVDDITKEEIINRNTQKLERETTIISLIYENPVIFISAIALFCIMLSFLVFLGYRIKGESLKRQKNEEYKKFLGYICTAVDGVSELNIKERTINRYAMRDGVLVEEFEKYPNNEWIMFHEEDREKIKELYSDENLHKLCNTGTASYSECRMLRNRATNEYHWCTCILQGIEPTKEKPFSLLLILKDTEEVKAREAQQKKALEDAYELAQQASQAKGSFLSKMSHEIRTPLNAIIGYLSIAKDSENDQAKIFHCIDNSEIAAKHLLSIINDVLDISSIESGRMKIAVDDFDLKKQITDISAIFSQNALQKGVKFEIHVADLTEEWVIGDGMRLNQILMNLLSNAVKFTPENGVVTLDIKQLRRDEKQVFIQFSVTDTGIGMSEEYMSRMFQPFEQESASTAQKYGGTGLGLSITNNLIKMMGGNISVKSTQGEGSQFSVTLHFGICENYNASNIKPADYSHIRALIVDDQKDEGTYVKSMLKRCGVKSDSVTSGELALKRLKSRADTEYSYDLCIIDWNMPDMNGMELAEKIRSEYGNDLPIVIATAYDTVNLTDAAKKLGIKKVISKPLFQSTLFDLLVSVFGKYDPQSNMTEKAKKIELSGLKVLLAEDNAMNMEIAVTVLEKAGVVVTQARDGKEAYDIFTASKEGTFDIILMDVQMPILNGYEATEKIRNSKHPQAEVIPVIAMTANAFAEDVAEALSHGMNAHISKPVNNEKLFSVLKRFMKTNTQ